MGGSKTILPPLATGGAKTRTLDGGNEGPEELARRPLLSQTLDVQGLGVGAGLAGDPYYEGVAAPRRAAANGIANAPPPCLDDDSSMHFEPARSPPIPSLIG